MTENFRWVWFVVCFSLNNFILVHCIQYRNNIDHLGFLLWEEGWGSWTATFPPCTCLATPLEDVLHYSISFICFILCFYAVGITVEYLQVKRYLLLFSFHCCGWKKRRRFFIMLLMVGTAWSSNKNSSKDWDSNFGWIFGLSASVSLKYMSGGDYYTEKLNWIGSVWGCP